MKNNTVLPILSIVLLFSGVAWAQEGFGLEGYLGAGLNKGTSSGGLGIGLGVKVFPDWSVSLGAGFSVVPGIAEGRAVYTGGGAGNVGGEELGGSICYKLKKIDPNLFSFVGYSWVSKGGLNRSLDLIHVGIGYVPFRWFIDLYPELSVVIPLEVHAFQQDGQFNADPVYIPVMLRVTIKLYVNP